jgi:hypothetical protein
MARQDKPPRWSVINASCYSSAHAKRLLLIQKSGEASDSRRRSKLMLEKSGLLPSTLPVEESRSRASEVRP